MQDGYSTRSLGKKHCVLYATNKKERPNDLSFCFSWCHENDVSLHRAVVEVDSAALVGGDAGPYITKPYALNFLYTINLSTNLVSPSSNTPIRSDCLLTSNRFLILYDAVC